MLFSNLYTILKVLKIFFILKSLKHLYKLKGENIENIINIRNFKFYLNKIYLFIYYVGINFLSISLNTL